jgi:lysozyme
MRCLSNDQENTHRNCNCGVRYILVGGVLSPPAGMLEDAPRNGKEGRVMKKFSANGQNKLKEWENFVAIPTPDLGGALTIGYGHKIKAGEKFGMISPEMGVRIMMQDVAPLEAFLNNYITPKLTQNQFDALVIFMFNIGDTGFLNSSVFRNIKDGKMEEATVPWAKWIHITVKEVDPTTGKTIKKLVPVPGLINRRAKELTLFRS